MIPKQKPTLETEGQGRGFEMNPRIDIEKDDAQRQKMIPIDLSDLNGQNGGKGMPKNFVRKAGRTIDSFTNYFTENGGEKDKKDVQ